MLRLAEKKDFGAMFALMEASFPKDEYRTKDEQRALFENPLYRVYAVDFPSNRSLCGFAAVWTLDSFCFLEHLAVDPHHRNGGVGARMLGELLVVFDGRICLEVELPETELSRRRIGFYERCGFTLNDDPYLQPPMSRGQNAVPLRIMTSWGRLRQNEFSSLRDLLYDKVYGVSKQH